MEIAQPRALPAQPGVRALSDCPHCGSRFVQPSRWRQLPDGRMMLELRCPECLVRMIGKFEPRLVAEFDKSLVSGRGKTVAAYERLLRSNMEAEADRLRVALERDLIGPEDF